MCRARPVQMMLVERSTKLRGKRALVFVVPDSCRRSGGSRVTGRRRSSRSVALTATFLALAAGAAAACDVSTSDEDDPFGTSYVSGPDNYSGGGSDSGGSSSTGSGVVDSDDSDSADVDSSASDLDGSDTGDVSSDDEVFYCADESAVVVADDYCQNDSDGASSYYFWHSPTYARGLALGSALDGGDSFPANDRQARRAFRLPTTGKVSNGTIKTNIVGQRSTGSAGG